MQGSERNKSEDRHYESWPRDNSELTPTIYYKRSRGHLYLYWKCVCVGVKRECNKVNLLLALYRRKL